MAFILEGDVEVIRVDELLDGNPANVRSKKFLTDELSDPKSAKYSFDVIEDAMMPDEKAQIIINTLFRPATEPSGSTITLNCENHAAAMFEPRLSVGTRTINANFTQAFSNVTNTNLVSCVYSFTGSIVVTMPSDVEVSNPSSIGTWDSGLGELTIAAGTDDIIEFHYLWNITEAIWLLIVSEVSS